jgi:hypothetical protein
MSSRVKKTSRKKARTKTSKSTIRPQKRDTEGGQKARKTAAEKRFIADLLVRGEATTLDSSGKLPLNATHVIEKENKDGTAEVRRVRYKLF